MPRPRKLSDAAITEILEWGQKWKDLPTRKQMADRHGVCEYTIDRVVRDGGYKTKTHNIDEYTRELRRSLEANFISNNSGASDPL